MIAYVVVERGTCRLLGQWWTPVCEIAQAEADLRGGIAVSAAYLAKRNGIDPTRVLPSFGRQADNNRSPKPAHIAETRAQIRAYENDRLATDRVA